MKLTFTIDGFSEMSVEVAKPMTASAIGTDVLAIPEIATKIKTLIAEEFEATYVRDGEIGQSMLDEAADAFLKQGMPGFESWAEGYVSHDEESDRILTALQSDETYRSILDTVAEAVNDTFKTDFDGDDLFDDVMIGFIDSAIEHSDTSVPMDLIQAYDTVMVSYSPALHFGIEDDAILGDRKSIEPLCVELVEVNGEKHLPDSYLAYFAMINLDKASLLDHLKDIGVDLFSDESKKSGHAAAWASATWAYDPQRPTLQDAQRALLVLENAGDCVIPTITFQVGLKELLNHDFTQAATITKTERGKAAAGFVNYVHGAGHEERIDAVAYVLPGREKWLAADSQSHGYSRVFGIVKSAYRATLASLPT